MIMTNEDVNIIEKFISIKNRGLYASGEQVTEVYNRVLEKNLKPTNCGSCIRHRIQELEDALRRFKKKIELENKAQEASKNEEVDNTPQEVKEANTEQMKEEMSDAIKQTTLKKKSRGKESRKGSE